MADIGGYTPKFMIQRIPKEIPYKNLSTEKTDNAHGNCLCMTAEALTAPTKPATSVFHVSTVDRNMNHLAGPYYLHFHQACPYFRPMGYCSYTNGADLERHDGSR